MSIVDPERPITRKFLQVVCPCGRALRAPTELGGEEIDCWECHRKVRVPVPKSSERAFRVITDGIRQVYEPQWLFLMFVGAAIVTGAFCINRIGIPIATAVLVLVLWATAS